MFALIRTIIESKGSSPREEREDAMRDNQVAAGVLLLEAAHADDKCTEKEQSCILSALKDRFDLSENHVAELLNLAEAHREQAIDFWQFSNQINHHFSVAEKLAVMEDVWRVILVDGHLEMHEDQYAHKLANLLRLSHDQLIAAKLKAKQRQN